MKAPLPILVACGLVAVCPWLHAEELVWPEGQALPTFSSPAGTLDAVVVQDLSPDEQITFSALQGQVNKVRPRILLLDGRAEEGRDTWADTATMALGKREIWPGARKYGLLKKYEGSFAGVVLYDAGTSPHYRNLACTAASQIGAVPVTAGILAEMKRAGVSPEISVDLTKLMLTDDIEIYQYMYDHFWGKSEKRVIISAKPMDQRGRGDYHHTRDMAAATGAAVVWLDTLTVEGRKMLGKFFADMKAGEAIALGWYASERSGVTTAARYGIGTMPADHFVSSTVYAGSDPFIKIPPVPKMPVLEDKVYVTIFISDGDNIQYTQHAMRRDWDRKADSRGKLALNWTIAPGLVDIAPGILNYYYTTATPMDCFVTGPSGMGYAMFGNTLKEPGAPVGNYLDDAGIMDGYTRLTGTYLRRSGLRVVTIWDNATAMQRASYERNCPDLYGATVQNFKDVPSVASSVEGGRLRFDKLVIPYAGSYGHIEGSFNRLIGKWDGKSPLFLSYQVDIWHELKPDRLVGLKRQLDEKFPGKLEFVRADHYFNLYNQAHGLPHNLSMSPNTRLSASVPAEGLENAMDGSPATFWTGAANDGLTVTMDLGGEHLVSRLSLLETSSGAYRIEASADGDVWEVIAEEAGGTSQDTDSRFPETSATQVRLVFEKTPEISVGDMEIYGK